MTERFAVRKCLPDRDELRSAKNIRGDARTWGNERPSMYERSRSVRLGRTFDTYDGGGSGSRDFSDSLESDEDLGGTEQSEVKRESGSDSDHQKWTKNPLMIRRVKRSNKPQPDMKRWSGTALGGPTGCKDDYKHPYNESGERLKQGRNSNEYGNSSKGISKYQRLEEMRKKRINLSITSDEEGAAPTSKIPFRYGSHSRNTLASSGSRVEPERQSEIFKSQIGTETVHKINLQTGRAPQTSTLPTHIFHVAPKAGNDSSRFQHLIAPSPSRTGSQMVNSEITGKTITYDLTSSYGMTSPPSVKRYSHPERTEPRDSLHGQPDVTGSRQPFYRIVNTKSPPSSRAIVNTPSQVTVHQFISPQVYAHTLNNSTADSPLKPSIAGTKQNYIKPKENFPQVNTIQSTALVKSYQQPNTAPSMRVVKKDTPKSTVVNSQNTLPSFRRAGHGDDSLDELVESNIRYLDRTADKATTKKNSNSLRVVGQADSKKVSQFGISQNQYNQPSVQVRTSTNIQLHVSVPIDNTYPANVGGAVPRMQIESATNRYRLDNQGISPPDVVPRKISRELDWMSQRKNIPYHNRDSLTQLEIPDQRVATVDNRNVFGPQASYITDFINDGITRSDTEICRPVKQLESGMFSDVEYDIEVSERVKKWESLFKVRDNKLSRNKQCDTIAENMEGEYLTLPATNKHVFSSQPFQVQSSYHKELVPGVQKEPRYESSILKSASSSTAKAPSVEIKSRRLFQVLPDTSQNAQSQNASKSFPSSRVDPMLASSHQSGQQTLENRASSAHVTNTSPVVTHKSQSVKHNDQLPIQTDTSRGTRQLQEDNETEPGTDKVVKRPSKLGNNRDLAKRRSAYREELDEISGMKTDTVNNLRRQFDTGSTTVTSEDDQRSVSKVSTKLARPSKDQKTPTEVDWSNVLPGYRSLIKDSDMWSPNLESTQGVHVSIERVTARTLQTIPFSEDPFWKEMEEMTSFDPTSSVCHPTLGISQEKSLTINPSWPHSHVERIPSQSFTLPSQSWNQAAAVKERIQKSKSLYTPNITPVSVGANKKTKSDAVLALDAVLHDINKSLLDRKQQNYEEERMEKENAPTLSKAVHRTQDQYIQPIETQAKRSSEQGHILQKQPVNNTYITSTIKSQLDNTRYETGIPDAREQNSFQQQPPPPPPPQQQHEQFKRQVYKPQPSQGNLSGYQLDPNLLKQKLLKTGLVVETDVEEAIDRRKSWPRSASAPGNSVIPSQPYLSKITTQSNKNFSPTNTTIPAPSEVPKLSSTKNESNSSSSYIKQSGLSTLDNLQNALSPFSSTTSYQPGPESLYGLSNLESFKNTNVSTPGDRLAILSSREAQVSTTDRTNHGLINTLVESSLDNKKGFVSTHSSRLQEVNQSMDELKHLALDVEQRINVIKNRLKSANENSLDSILSSLRALAPEDKRSESEPATLEDYYTTRKTKLSDALTELDRIYTSLELNSHENKNLPGIRDHHGNGGHVSSYPIVSTQPRSVHLRPMQTRISSVYIRGLDSTNKNKTGEEKESQSDVLAQSFQAIVDEVNKTTELLSRVAERNRQENRAPETQKQISKDAARSDKADQASALHCLNTDEVTPYKIPLVPVDNSSLIVNSVDSKLKPKLETCFKDDTGDKVIREGVSHREIDTDNSFKKVLHSGTGQEPQKAVTSVVKVTVSAATEETLSAAKVTPHQYQTEYLPEKKTEPDDRDPMQKSGEQTLWISSPTQSRKLNTNINDREQQIFAEKRAEETRNIQPLPGSELDRANSKVEVDQPKPTSSQLKGSATTSEYGSASSVAASTITSKDFVKSNNVTSPPVLSSCIPKETPSNDKRNCRVMSLDPNQADSESAPSNNDPNVTNQNKTSTALTESLNPNKSLDTSSVKSLSHPQTISEAVKTTTENVGDKDNKQLQKQQTISNELNKISNQLSNLEVNFPKSQSQSTCEKSAVSFLMKKVGDSDTKSTMHDLNSSQPSTPINKSVLSFLDKDILKSEKPNHQFEADLPKTALSASDALSSGGSTPPNGYLTPKEGESTKEGQTEDIKPRSDSPNRPHSFHELISCSETNKDGTQANDNFRKFSSSGEVTNDTH